jgi:hypothetical protein
MESIRSAILTLAFINGAVLLAAMVIAILRCLRFRTVGGGRKLTWDASIPVHETDLSPLLRTRIMTLKTSVDLFDRERAIKMLEDVDSTRVLDALWEARAIAIENDQKQMNLIREISARKHSLEVVTNLNQQYQEAQLREDAAWRQYEVLRFVLISRGVIRDDVVPTPNGEM